MQTAIPSVELQDFWLKIFGQIQIYCLDYYSVKIEYKQNIRYSPTTDIKNLWTQNEGRKQLHSIYQSWWKDPP